MWIVGQNRDIKLKVGRDSAEIGTETGHILGLRRDRN